MSFGGNSMGGIMFSVIPTLVVLGFVFFFIVVIYKAVKGVGQWSYNNAQPVLTVPARAVIKRTEVSSSVSHMNEMAHHHTDTTYYITFQVESGDRMEFKVRGGDYGMIAEEDSGRLTFQGSRFLGFERTVGMGE